MCARQFQVTIMNDGSALPAKIYVLNDTISLCISDTAYYVFSAQSISFDCVQGIHLLVCGDLALCIDSACFDSLLPLFAITSPIAEITRECNTGSVFKDIILRTRKTYAHGKDPRIPVPNRDAAAEASIPSPKKVPGLFKVKDKKERILAIKSRATRSQTLI